MLVCCYPYDHTCFSCQLTLSVYIDCSRAYSVFLTDLFSFASFLPFPPPRFSGWEYWSLAWISDRLLVGFSSCTVWHEASYGYHFFWGLVLMYFSFSVDVVLSRLVYLESYVVPDLFWNVLKSSAVLSMLFTLFTYIHMFLFCLDLSLCMFTRFKRPSKVRVLARDTLAEVGCYIFSF